MSVPSILRKILSIPGNVRGAGRRATNRWSHRPTLEALEDRDCPSGTSVWTQLTPLGPAPSARYLHTAVEDQAHDRMIVFGGVGLNDVWVLANADGVGGTPAWTQLNPLGTPPSARDNASAVYDPVDNEMFVFGGDTRPGSNGDVNDTWVLTNANGLADTPQWIQLTPTGSLPEIRRQAGLAYDATSNRMILVGGLDGTQPFPQQDLHDVWVLENANRLTGTPTWIQLNLIGTAGPLEQGPMGYDPATNRVILFDTGAPPYGDNNTWVLSNANGLGGDPVWTQLSPTGTPPSPRYQFAACYDPLTNQMTVFGGNDNSTIHNDVYTLTHANGLGGIPVWTQVNAGSPAPDPRLRTTAVVNPTSGIMTVFGGDNGSTIFGDVWVISVGPKALTVDANTQGTINIAKAGTISFALQITDGLVASDNNVAALFNGATFTITVGNTSYSLTSTATVAPGGTINVSMRMSQGLQNAMLAALSEGTIIDFSLFGMSNDGDYMIAADAFSRLISQGKLKFDTV